MTTLSFFRRFITVFVVVVTICDGGGGGSGGGGGGSGGGGIFVIISSFVRLNVIEMNYCEMAFDRRTWRFDAIHKGNKKTTVLPLKQKLCET